MGIVFKNNAKTTLASSLSNSATSATVTDGSVFPSLSAGEFFLVTFDDGSNNEICKCTARSGNTLTIVRAQESTTARAFSSGDAAEGRVTAGVLETIQENIAAKSANQTVFNTTTAGGATTYNIGTNPGVEANAMVFLNGVLQHHDTLSFSGTNLTFDAAPPNGMALEVIIDNLINLQSSNLTVDSFTAADVVGVGPQTDFVLSDTPAAETNLIVFVDGVFQDQDAYTISSNTLTITTGVIAGRGVTVYVINPVNIGTPSDSTVTSAKLSGNITMPGTLTVGSNDVAFDSPTFVVDHTNSRVGLGTASPSVPVDIVGDVKMSANLTVDTDTLVVDSSNDRVGIGITNPGAKLSVNTGTVNTLAHFHSTDDNGFIELKDDDTTGYIGVQNDYVYVGGAPSTNAQNIVIHKTTGNTGIGTASPSNPLHIVDSRNYTFSSTADASTNMAGIRLTNSNNNNNWAGLWFGTGSAAGTHWSGIAGARTDSTSTWGTHLSFFTHEDTIQNITQASERLRISPSGNIGLGTTDPDENLTIASTAPTIKFVDTDVTEQNTIVKQSGGNFFIIARNNTDNAGIVFMGNGGGSTDEYARFLANGNLGLDDTSPMSRIQVGTPNSMTASHYGRAEYAGLNLTIPNSVGAANQIIFSNAAAESYGYGGLGMVMTSGSGVGLADMVTTIKTTGSNAVAIERLRIFADDRPKYSFGTTSTGVNDGPAMFAASTSPSSNTHLWFHFLEAENHGSAAGVKVGGFLASSSYALATPSRGNMYAQGNVSAATFTDRTPYPTSLQLAKDVINSHQRRSEEEITRMATEQYNKVQEESDMPQPERESLSLEEFLDKHKKEYELDHSVLHDYVNDTEYAENGIEGRDASATISCLVEVVKDLMQRLETLENG